jgi:carboxymethylenebutenolidase
MQITLTAEDGHSLTAWTDGPADATRGIVLVQEIFGVNRHIRRLAGVFAAAGYRVVAPALFDRTAPGTELGYTPDEVAKGRALKGTVPEAGSVMDVAAAAAALPTGAVRGIVGYCWGGTLAWLGATRVPGFTAAVGWYGGGIAAARAETPRCPVQLHFGTTDAAIPMADVAAIGAAQPGVEIHVYEGAGHGFGCEERPSYSPADAALAERRTLDFLARHLG